MQKEIWKDVPGYEGAYIISSSGLIKSLVRKNVLIDKILSPTIDNSNGYVVVNLLKSGKHKLHYMHRLKAIMFIPNPENKPCVNHKDGIKTNNELSNLEWVTHSENNKHAFDTGLKKPTYKGVIGKDHFNSMSVVQYSKKMVKIKEFGCISTASRELGTSGSNISSCMKGRRKTAGGYVWRSK